MPATIGTPRLMESTHQTDHLGKTLAEIVARQAAKQRIATDLPTACDRWRRNFIKRCIFEGNDAAVRR